MEPAVFQAPEPPVGRAVRGQGRGRPVPAVGRDTLGSVQKWIPVSTRNSNKLLAYRSALLQPTSRSV
ncbi:hypothetical protein SBV1_1170019 [Verrucomicrobia bacterium]|nr:hypothetical protein SBV1_1170019 [Verrucomicrobiota bacterium]